MKKIAVVPAFEPDDNIISLVKELKKNNYLIVVVNDGSNEKFNNIFEKIKEDSIILTHDLNKGKGSSLKTAFSYIKDNYSNYYIITLDCDGQHKVSDANKLIEYLEKNQNELVIGKRIRSNKTPVRSRIGNMITRFVYKISTGVDIYDTQTGLRAFTDSLMDFMLNVSGDRYEYEMNVLLECPKNNIKIKEIEIETIYINNNSNSHFNTLKDSYKIYKQIFKFSCVSLSSFIIDYVLYVLFNIILNNIILSNILSRIISSYVNYNLNEKIVFNGKNNKSFIKYCLLVITILLLNTILLNTLVNYIFINKYIAKVIVELILFILSFIIQKIFVFKK